MSKGGTPITSEYIIDLVADNIRKKRECYYIILRLILETGITLTNIPKLKVKDIKGETISFNPVHKYVTRVEKLSPELQEEIAEYTKGKGDDDLAFTAYRDNTKPLFERGFQKALTAASEFYNIEPPVTSERLRRTYIYNLLVKEHDLDKIRSITGCRSPKEVYEYLSLPLPKSKNAERLESYSQRDALLKEKLIEKTAEHFSSVMKSIEVELSVPDRADVEYIDNTMRLLSDINNRLSDFEEKSKF